MIQRKVLILRNVMESVQSLGNMYVFNGAGKELFSCKTLERAYLDNAPMVSAVMAGEYDLSLDYSPRFDEYLWELYGVPDRSECKIHVSNFWTQINGCIAPGDMHLDINGDGARDVRNSRRTLNKFHAVMNPLRDTTIRIINF